jgi:hypothetical protein
MTDVTAWRVRSHGRQIARRICSGFLVRYPAVGRGMVIFRDDSMGDRMITTPVRRVLMTADGQALYVETQNSVYRLHLHVTA